MKYWNVRRVQRHREREAAREKAAQEKQRENAIRKRTYTKGDTRKNARLMLEALGNPTHRRMLARLRTGGAMSVSHLARPFGIMLSDTMRHVHILERAGLITTKKTGRIRFCIYNSAALKELAAWLITSRPFEVD